MVTVVGHHMRKPMVLQPILNPADIKSISQNNPAFICQNMYLNQYDEERQKSSKKLGHTMNISHPFMKQKKQRITFCPKHLHSCQKRKTQQEKRINQQSTTTNWHNNTRQRERNPPVYEKGSVHQI